MSNGVSIEVNGQMLVLSPNTKVKFLIKSEVFVAGIEPPSRSFNIRVPVVPNAFILQNAHLLNARIRIYEIEAKVYLFNNFWKTAKLQFQDTTSSYYNARLLIDRGFFADMGQSRLRSFKYNNPTKYRAFDASVAYREYLFSFLSGIPSSGDPTAIICLIDNPEKKNEQFEYRIPYSPPETLLTFINRIRDTINGGFKLHGIRVDLVGVNSLRFINTWGNGQYPSVLFTAADLTYYDYFNDPNNSSNYSANTGTQQTNHANDVAANPGNYDYAFFPVRVPSFAGSGSGNDFTGVVNDWSQAAISPFSSGFRGMQNPTAPFTDPNNRNGLSPSAYVYDILRMIHEELNINIDDQFFDDELKSLLVWSPVVTDQTWNGTQKYSPSFLYSDILPDITYGDFVNALTSAFGFLPIYDAVKRSVLFTSRKKIINSPDYEDWSEFAVGEYQIERFSQNINLQYAWPQDEGLKDKRLSKSTLFNYKGQVDVYPSTGDSSNRDMVLLRAKNHYQYFTSYFGGGEWNFVAEQLENTDKAPPSTDMSLGFSTLFSDVFTTNYKWDPSIRINKWLLPYTEVPAQFITAQTEGWPIRFLFYRGMQPGEYQAGSDPEDLTAFQYPLGHYHNYNYLGEKIGDYSLALHGEDGLIEKFLKDWIELSEISEPVKWDAKLGLEKILSLDRLKKKRIFNQDFLIDEIEISVSDVIEISAPKYYQLRKRYE